MTSFTAWTAPNSRIISASCGKSEIKPMERIHSVLKREPKADNSPGPRPARLKRMKSMTYRYVQRSTSKLLSLLRITETLPPAILEKKFEA